MPMQHAVMTIVVIIALLLLAGSLTWMILGIIAGNSRRAERGLIASVCGLVVVAITVFTTWAIYD